MAARIYQPAKTSMQSGTARTAKWVLDYEPEAPRGLDPLMGWTTSSDMKSQLQLSFDSQQEAVDYAERHNIAYEVSQPHKRVARPKAYADNFSFKRQSSWTH